MLTRKPIEFYSNSSMSTFRRCTFRFWETYGYEGRSDGEQNEGMRLGSAGHMAFKAYYSGHSTATALDWAYSEFNPVNRSDQDKFKHLTKVLQAYWLTYATDNWKVVLLEQEIKLGRLMMIVDAVIEDSYGRKYIVDHKFKKSLNTYHLDMDTQVSLYLYLARELDWKVDGLLYNMIDTGKVGHYRREYCTRSNKYLDSFGADLVTQIGVMDNFFLDPKPYRNQTEHCKWGCDLYQYCMDRLEQKPQSFVKLDR